MRFGLLAVGGWLVAAVLTVAVSWSAVGVVRKAVSPDATVAASLPAPDETSAAATPSTTPSTTRPRPTTPAPNPAVRQGGRGGTVTVRCAGGVPQFLNITPNQGYDFRQDDSSPEVEFSSAAGRTEITAGCTGATPRISVEEKDPRGGDDSGGNSGRGGGNSGRGGGDDD